MQFPVSMMNDGLIDIAVWERVGLHICPATLSTHDVVGLTNGPDQRDGRRRERCLVLVSQRKLHCSMVRRS
jgi:hypothetical protein